MLDLVGTHASFRSSFELLAHISHQEFSVQVEHLPLMRGFVWLRIWNRAFYFFTNPVESSKIRICGIRHLHHIKERDYSVENVLTRALVVLIRSIMRAVPAVREGMHMKPSHWVGWVCWLDAERVACGVELCRIQWILVLLIGSWVIGVSCLWEREEECVRLKYFPGKKNTDN